MLSRFDELVNSLAVKSELNQLLEDVQDLAKSVNQLDEKGLTHQLENCTNLELVTFLKNELPKIENGQVTAYFENLEDAVRNIRVVEIEFAWDPEYKFLQEVSSKISQFMGKKTVIQIVVNKELIGGAKITYNGKILDYSILAKWEGFWNEVEAHLK
jgi:F0F1-type ATP synthase delta subunit